MHRRAAARPKCNSSATATKHRKWFSSIIMSIKVLIDTEHSLDLYRLPAYTRFRSGPHRPEARRAVVLPPSHGHVRHIKDGDLMPLDVLLINPVTPALAKELGALYTVHRYYDLADKAGFLREAGPQIAGVVTGGASGISNELMDAMPNLRIVAINGIGTDAVDLNYARSHCIHVST